VDYNLITYCLIIIVSAICLINIITCIKLINQEKKLSELRLQIQSDNHNTATEYSEKMLDFVKMLTSQIAVLRFRTFVDTHELDKITKANVQKLVTDVAETVHNSINIDNIDFEDMLFNKEFFEKYIIETSLITIKSLLDKAVNEE